MPKTAIDYSTTIIYKIVCNNTAITDLYVGHTTNFRVRKNSHKSKSCSSSSNLRLYQCIQQNGGFDNWSMVEIEKYPCNNRLEACKRERFWLENMKATLNQNVPSRSQKESFKIYYDKNKDLILDNIAKYRENHTQEAKEYALQYRRANAEAIKKQKGQKCICECGVCYTHSHKSRHLSSKKHQNFLQNAEE